MADREIKIPITGDSSGYKKALGEAEQATGKFSKATGNAGNALKAAFVGGAVVAGLHDVIDAASDYNETVSKTKVVLGSAADGAIDFAESAAESFGLSAQAALDAQSTFATFGKSAGLAGDDLGAFAKNLTGLAADMASFSNTSPEQAIEAIGAALRGEAEPIRAYGVLLDDATLKAAAMKLGIYDGNGALTQQQKVLAAQAAIMAQTSDAQGDFARTSGGLAGQQKILSAEIDNLKVTMGQKLIPVAIKVISTILDVGEAFGNFSSGIDLSTESFKKFFKEANNKTTIKAVGDQLHAMAKAADESEGFFTRLGSSLFDSRWDAVNDVFQKMGQESPAALRDVYDQLVLLKEASDAGDPAARKLAEDYEITDKHLGDLYDTFLKVTPAIAETDRETRKLSGSMGEAGFAVIDARKALQEQSIALGEAARQAGAAQRATDNLEASWDQLKGTLSDQQAWIDVQDSFDDVKQKGIDAFTAAAENSDTAAQAARDYQSALIDLKGKVIDYANEVGGLPPEVVSKIVADIDEGSVANAEALLDRIAHERQVIYNAQVAGHREFEKRAGGGPVEAGQIYMVGEHGPELFASDEAGRIVDAQQTGTIRGNYSASANAAAAARASRGNYSPTAAAAAASRASRGNYSPTAVAAAAVAAAAALPEVWRAAEGQDPWGRDLEALNGIPYRGGGSSGGGNITLNVYAGLGTDGYEVAKVIVNCLGEYDRRNGTHIVTPAGR